jgi:hypothetical protein
MLNGYIISHAAKCSFPFHFQTKFSLQRWLIAHYIHVHNDTKSLPARFPGVNIKLQDTMHFIILDEKAE